MDRESKASKMFIIVYCFLFWGTKKKCRTSQLMVNWQASQKKKKILLAHKDNSTLQKLSIESEIIMQMRQVESQSKLRTL